VIKYWILKANMFINFEESVINNILIIMLLYHELNLF
jgi:hypothetical protein